MHLGIELKKSLHSVMKFSRLMVCIFIWGQEPMSLRLKIQEYVNHMSQDDLGLYASIINEVERHLLEAVMDKVAGNQSKAAVLLGISRGTLKRKLQSLAIEYK